MNRTCSVESGSAEISVWFLMSVIVNDGLQVHWWNSKFVIHMLWIHRILFSYSFRIHKGTNSPQTLFLCIWNTLKKLLNYHRFSSIYVSLCQLSYFCVWSTEQTIVVAIFVLMYFVSHTMMLGDLATMTIKIDASKKIKIYWRWNTTLSENLWCAKRWQRSKCAILLLRFKWQQILMYISELNTNQPSCCLFRLYFFIFNLFCSTLRECVLCMFNQYGKAQFSMFSENDWQMR